ncbi:putative rRNA-processing protein EBP2 [Halotydeus destructor]|nr:putative rRNA-processing protein EBP2 [Halotydeus destructor]
MGKKQRVPLSKIPMEVEVSEDDVQNDSENENAGSDEELMEAFARGELKPGLSTLVKYQRKEEVNNVEILNQKLKDISKDLAWIERMDVTNNPLPPSENIDPHFGDISLKMNKKGEVSGEEKLDKAHHDFKREMQFYRQAQAAAALALPKLTKLGVLTLRPQDYFAQMVKTDAHMKKVRASLIEKQESMIKSEKAKKLRQNKKMGKQIQVEVLKKRQEEKRNILDKVKQFKKGNTKQLDLDGPRKQGKGGSKGGKGKKKDYKDTRFGYGGRKRGSKSNTAESSAEFGGYSRNRNGAPNMGKSKGGSRPGKNRRVQIKSRRK